MQDPHLDNVCQGSSYGHGDRTVRDETGKEKEKRKPIFVVIWISGYNLSPEVLTDQFIIYFKIFAGLFIQILF